uniref:Uncharacterized protein n=1 Tax=Triticum urartu TaxID=4572 RepID=A0A8R7U0S5_TRIUA
MLATWDWMLAARRWGRGRRSAALGEVRTRLVTTKEKTMKTRQRDPASPARDSAGSSASSAMTGHSRNRSQMPPPRMTRERTRTPTRGRWWRPCP